MIDNPQRGCCAILAALFFTPYPCATITKHSSINDYWERSKWPLQSLYFLLPMLVVYEVGASLLWQDNRPLTANRMIWEVFESFGIAGGVHLPAVALVVVMLVSHIARKTDPWAPEPKLYVGMAFESLVFAAPLFVMMTVLFSRSSSMPAASGLGALLAPDQLGPWAQWRASVVVALGAGIYEEIIFRLVAIALIHMITKDLLALPEELCVGSAVVLSSLASAQPCWYRLLENTSTS